MIPDFTAEDVALRDSVRRFAQRELAPRAAAFDESAAFVGAHLPQLADLGIMGLNLPEEFGGAGVSALGLSAAVEEIAAACSATASMVTAHYLASDAILLAGSGEQKQRYLPDAASGKTLGAFALTEPAAGSNPADMTTSVVPTAAGFHLRGTKHFISNAGHADFIIVFARGGQAGPRAVIDAFIVDRGTKGVSFAAPEPVMGMRGSHVFEIALDCGLPADARLGESGSGFRTAMQVLDRGRVEVAALALGICQAALDATLGWISQRKVDGKPLAERQGVQWMIADMATEIEAARLLTWRAAALRQAGEPFAQAAAMAKLTASETAGRVVDRALQLHGGYGYSRRLPLERLARDARILRIYEGASEIQRNIIARHLLRESSR
ncbi:MAG TPA: acyl-CoA dehydrogenase family protein [Dongiaceae bacterium]|jgi:alkylation response protein AidB-like acyl-CoA dehydrogenase|nr:acyl-CoA dehydrogenase family protein [Dongiaceae bacterium]